MELLPWAMAARASKRLDMASRGAAEAATGGAVAVQAAVEDSEKMPGIVDKVKLREENGV